MKTNCESFNKSLQTNSLVAFICKYECTLYYRLCEKYFKRKISKLWWGF